MPPRPRRRPPPLAGRLPAPPSAPGLHRGIDPIAPGSTSPEPCRPPCRLRRLHLDVASDCLDIVGAALLDDPDLVAAVRLPQALPEQALTQLQARCEPLPLPSRALVALVATHIDLRACATHPCAAARFYCRHCRSPPPRCRLLRPMASDARRRPWRPKLLLSPVARRLTCWLAPFRCRQRCHAAAPFLFSCCSCLRGRRCPAASQMAWASTLLGWRPRALRL